MSTYTQIILLQNIPTMPLSLFRGIIIILFALVTFACNQPANDSDSANQESSFTADIHLSLVHKWSLNDLEQFPNLTYFQTTGDGNLITGDYALSKFYLIDKAGNILKTFGGKGRGPGELNSITALATHPDGFFAIADNSNRIISIFNADDDEVITVDFEAGWNTSIMWVNDKLIIINNPFLKHNRDIKSGSMVIRSYDPNSETIEELMVFELELQNAPPEQISCTFCPVVFADEHHFFTFKRDTTYQFHKVDVRTGVSESFAFTGLSDVVKFTESEHESIRQNRKRVREVTGQDLPESTLPTHKNRFTKLFTDTEKRVWLQLNAHQDSTKHFDVFTETGTYLGSVDFPENADYAEDFSEHGILFRFSDDDSDSYSLKLFSID